MLVETDMLGIQRDKVQRAIDIARAFEPNEGYYLAYSGGKDSVVVKHILDLAGVKYDAHYNVTTVDPPELVRFVISQFEAVIYQYADGRDDKYFLTNGSGLLERCTKDDITGLKVIVFELPKLSMRKLIIKKGILPLRTTRYCCAELKESNGNGRIVVTGVRKAESNNRKRNHGYVTMLGSKSKKTRIINIAKEANAEYAVSQKGGIRLLNYDNGEKQTVETCYRTNKTLVNPILDFDEDDVWELIKRDDLDYCKLYDEGFKRLGCIGCPMTSVRERERAFQRWPAYKKLYQAALHELCKTKEMRTTEEQYFARWMNDKALFDDEPLIDQIGMFEDV